MSAMFANKTRVLLILPQEALDRARMMAGRATMTLRMPVSLQIVLRALIEEGLRRGDDRALLANIERQARMVRDIRIAARRGAAETAGGRGSRAGGAGREARSR